MKIDLDTIEKVAHLARLEVKDEDKQGLLDDMNNILTFMDKLNEVNTDNVEPLIYMSDEVNVVRDDEVIQVISHEQALQNAPKHDGKYFRVAKVINKQ
ncbi:Asp-tRNA(Asn)/Glu-tRNA(Gln) amidotransferase subunit GatC [Daejeonella lutea]|uniref:Aspartyl/glutamyl-tRNA(Asn/Gln) amidotransferase subunit C n=1 Tax=Daejeonella lutea TaxID=572036 RepID=A0A1T5B5D7_9SPHI|nr:Asp-tRNA(Asn)/Glu-tRNA(Gln) amidotransferase subunit GatC [Daejeonella lutea]SKB42474.1 aspartyl/glutamyl-tRNA(Asn/Gln) amidotransferase subunit C [Daejeonella lutea]